jgi:hypothetical protein
MTLRPRRCGSAGGGRLPELFVAAGVGAPDGTDVTGRADPLATARNMFEGVYRSLLPVALARGITTEEEAESTLTALDRDAARHAARPALWPLLVGVWKRKDFERAEPWVGGTAA